MKIAAFALASTFALTIGCAQPVLAQTQDQTGARPYAQDRTDMDNGAATTGDNADEQNGTWRDDESANDRDRMRRDRGWRDGRMGMGPMMMWRRHQMMLNAMGGARFHFARGKARMDIRCPAQTNLQVCVHAATELLDKIAQLRNGGGDTTGSATENSDRTNGSAVGQQPDTQDGGAAPGGDNPQAPRVPGDRM